MRSATSIIRTASIVLIQFAMTTMSLHAAGPATHPTAPATQPENADIVAGRERAKRDAAAGKFSFKLVQPEAFVLMDMSPGSENYHKVDYFIALLDDRYGIKASSVVVLPGGSAEACFAQGYDEVIVTAIEAKFGKGVLDKVWREAGKTKDAKRGEYLEKRKAAATQASTKPAGDRSLNPRK